MTVFSFSKIVFVCLYLIAFSACSAREPSVPFSEFGTNTPSTETCPKFAHAIERASHRMELRTIGE